MKHFGSVCSRISCRHQTVIFDRYSAACRWIVVHWFEALKRPKKTYFAAFFAANIILLTYLLLDVDYEKIITRARFDGCFLWCRIGTIASYGIRCC